MNERQKRADVRSYGFFYLLPAIGFVGVGVLALPFRQLNNSARERKAARRLLTWTGLSIIPWVLLEFEPGSTVIHQGSYAMVLAAMTGAILAPHSIWPRLSVALCVVQIVFSWLVYEPNLTQVLFPDSLSTIWNPWMFGVHIVAALGFVLLCYSPILIKRWSRQD